MNIDLAIIRLMADEIRPLCGDDETLYLDTLDGETDVADILDALIADAARDRGLIDGLKAAEAQMKARRQRVEMRQDTARRLIGSLLRAANIRKAERPIATVSVRDGNVGVRIIGDGSEVPRQLCTIKEVVTPDKAAIKAQIEAGVDVPGAEIAQGDDIVTVRFS